MRRLGSFIALAIALGCAMPAAALERSAAVSDLAQQLVFDRVGDAPALQALIEDTLPASAKGNAWDKLALGIRYIALANWADVAPNPSGGAMSPGESMLPAPEISDKQATAQQPIDYTQEGVNWLKVAVSEGLGAASNAKCNQMLCRRAGSLAAETLGEIYVLGVDAAVQSEGIKPDLVEAYVWFSLAAEEHEATASANLKEVKARLSEAELGEANKRLERFLSDRVPFLDRRSDPASRPAKGDAGHRSSRDRRRAPAG